MAAYRIVQEAVMNAVRHANAQHCQVDLCLNGSLVVQVTDDGDGRVPAHPGTGLLSMRERAEELGGDCIVTFAPGRGTSVCATLPVPPLTSPND